MNKIVDLRSDTTTRPTAGMRAAMMNAPLGDDVFGDDPSVNELQEKIADMLGFEDALFMPTGTQSNLCGILAHCQRGDEYLVGHHAHTYLWEAGGAAVLGSVQPQPIAHQPDGTLALKDIEAAIKIDDPHFARSRLLTLENTLGGKRMPISYLQQSTDVARARGLATHLDGARLFNAAVAQAEAQKTNPRDEARRIAQYFDSVSVCFSKGLGAPVGSALCGSKELIYRARRLRKMAGGGMRQAGVLASAASYALDHHIDRLAEDHALMRELYAHLKDIPGLSMEAPQTNILFIDLQDEARERAQALVDHLKSRGVMVIGLYRLRMVTHLDVNAEGIHQAVAAIREFFGA
jgi:threonine aldolase